MLIFHCVDVDVLSNSHLNNEIIHPTNATKKDKSYMIAPASLPLGPLAQYPNE